MQLKFLTSFKFLTGILKGRKDSKNLGTFLIRNLLLVENFYQVLSLVPSKNAALSIMHILLDLVESSSLSFKLSISISLVKLTLHEMAKFDAVQYYFFF